jgi:hypothetical protein
METLPQSEIYHSTCKKVTVCKQSVTGRQLCRRLSFAVLGTVLTLTPMACGHQEPPAPTATPANHGRPHPTTLSGSGTFTSPDPTSNVITYNPSLAPVDVAILTSVIPGGYDYSRTVATLVVAGLLPTGAMPFTPTPTPVAPPAKTQGRTTKITLIPPQRPKPHRPIRSTPTPAMKSG